MHLHYRYFDCQNKRGDVISALGLGKRAAPTWGRELVWPPELAQIDILLTRLGAHSIASLSGAFKTYFHVYFGGLWGPCRIW